MCEFYEQFKEVLDEKGLKISDLEEAKVLKKDVFYNFKRNCPSLINAINIANFLEMSLDYILGKTDINTFKKYDIIQKAFYKQLTIQLKINSISQYKMAKDLGISDSTFLRWKNGTLPKFSTIIAIADYLGCAVDDLLEHE